MHKQGCVETHAYILVILGVRPFPNLILLLEIDLLRHRIVVEQARVHNAPFQVTCCQLVGFKQHMHGAQRVDKVLVRPLVGVVVHTDVLRKDFHVVVEMVLGHSRQPTPQQADRRHGELTEQDLNGGGWEEGGEIVYLQAVLTGL